MAVNAIRAIRESQGKSRKDLAIAIHRSELSVWRYEEGKGNPSLETLQAIAMELGVEVVDLLVPIPGPQSPVAMEGD